MLRNVSQNISFPKFQIHITWPAKLPEMTVMNGRNLTWFVLHHTKACEIHKQTWMAGPVVTLTNWNYCYRQSLWVSNLPEVQTTTDGSSSYSTHNTIMLEIQVHISWTSAYVLNWFLKKTKELSKSVQFMQ